MSTALSLESGLAASNVSFLVGYEGAFSEPTLPGAYTFYQDVINVQTEYTYLEMLANYPQMREWIGARREMYFRQYEQQIKLKTYEATIAFPRKSLQYRDRLGLIAKGINNWLAQQKLAYDKSAFGAYLSNAGAGPTGYDGAALFSTAHPHSATGGNQSNLAAGANLNAATLDAAMTAMMSLQLENGEPANYRPTHLIVGPALARRAKMLVGFDTRVIVVDANGKLDATASGVSATTAPNAFNGELTLVVDMRRVGTVNGTNVSYFWDLVDASRPGIRPMIKLVGMPPTPGHQDQPDSPSRFWKDKVIYGLVGDWVDDAGLWLSAYRATGTA